MRALEARQHKLTRLLRRSLYLWVSPSYTRLQIGRAGERAARKYLTRRGYEILCANWRCKFGELDIVAAKAKELLIIEVKTRTERNGSQDISPFENIDWKKVRRLFLLARMYRSSHRALLKRRRLWDTRVVALAVRRADGSYSVEERELTLYTGPE